MKSLIKLALIGMLSALSLNAAQAACECGGKEKCKECCGDKCGECTKPCCKK